MASWEQPVIGARPKRSDAKEGVWYILVQKERDVANGKANHPLLFPWKSTQSTGSSGRPRRLRREGLAFRSKTKESTAVYGALSSRMKGGTSRYMNNTEGTRCRAPDPWTPDASVGIYGLDRSARPTSVACDVGAARRARFFAARRPMNESWYILFDPGTSSLIPVHHGSDKHCARPTSVASDVGAARRA